MKLRYIKYQLLFTAFTVIICSCKKTLIESPHALLTPQFFGTAQGFQSGLDAAYGGTRSIWGTENMMDMTCGGTDEWIGAAGGNTDIMQYSSSYDSSNGYVDGIWQPIYTYINTLNGVIDNSATVTGLDAATVKGKTAEAKFLRANYYFLLVQFWGPVTLYQHFNTTPTTAATRAPIADVYNFIIQDLKDAIAGLPPSPVQNGVLPGKATAAAARHLLAKVYLTRGYSSAKQSDDFANALAMAKGLLNDSGTLGLGLQTDFGSVWAEGNEANNEVLWTVQHTTAVAYNGPDNQLLFFFVNGYTALPGMQRNQLYGRPFTRVRGTDWLFNTAFADKKNDTRYYKTFASVWLANYAATIPVVSGQPKFALGDTAIYMPGYNVSDAQVAASRYALIPPRLYNTINFPTMTKYTDTHRVGINDPSVRPVIVYRLAETYLIAAEAALQTGDLTTAATYLNKVRERAAYPTGKIAAMDITPAQVTLDFILDERSRELAGENVRWLDLVRTGKLVERVKLYNQDAAPNIKDFDVLRPIPQKQIDQVSTGPKYPQNQGF